MLSYSEDLLVLNFSMSTKRMINWLQFTDFFFFFFLINWEFNTCIYSPHVALSIAREISTKLSMDAQQSLKKKLISQ